MSDSRYRPKGQRKAPSSYTRLNETRPLRRRFQRFARQALRAINLEELWEPRERLKPDFWD